MTLKPNDIDAVADAIAERLNRDASPWLNTERAAAYIDSTPDSLKTWRCRGEGPPYHRVNGRLIRYRREALDAWLRNGGQSDESEQKKAEST